MAYTSFYGGRIGASFVIVKHFDGIDIPYEYNPVTQREEPKVFKRNIYAVHIDVDHNNEKFPIVHKEDTSPISYTLIEQTPDNYKDYEWDAYDLNGQEISCWVENKDPEDQNDPQFVDIELENKPAEGMVQCFKQGGITTSGENGVNYGEYVLIDTIVGLHEKNNPDNGKVFRRGMDYDYDKDNNPLAGAEYIGQIVGPQGETPEMDLKHYYEIENDGEPLVKKDYDEVSADLIPGSTKNDLGIRTYTDKIKWIYKNIRDPLGNIQGCALGFKIPTLIMDFVGNSVSPYYNRINNPNPDPLDPNTKYLQTDLIIEDENEYTDQYRRLESDATFDENLTYYKYNENNDTYSEEDVDAENFKEKLALGLYILGKGWTHPFYQKWQVSIPHGYHGIDSTNIQIIHTKTMPQYFKSNDFAGTPVYSDTDFTQQITILTESKDILREAQYDPQDEAHTVYSPSDELIYNANDQIKYCKVIYNDDGDVGYVKKEDCYMNVVRYKEIYWDNVPEGEYRYYYIGKYNEIERLSLAANGELSVFYSAETMPRILEQALRWIDTSLDKQGKPMGMQIDAYGTLTVYYNTLIEKNGQTIHESQEYPHLMTWITGVDLNPNTGIFQVTYNNDNILKDGNNVYSQTLSWVKDINVLEDGTIQVFYVDKNDPTSFEKRIKYLKDVYVNTNVPNSREGTGDQKIHLKYNTTDEEEIIGNPLNYIIETTIYIPHGNYNKNSYYGHVLVYYSDPELRNFYRDQNKCVTYPSTKIKQIDPQTGEEVFVVLNDWVDLGSAISTNGVGSLTTVAHLNDLWDDQKHEWIPPEKLKDQNEVVINPNAAGWLVTVCDTSQSPTPPQEFYAYDYSQKNWYYIGTLDSSTINAKVVVDIGEDVGGKISGKEDILNNDGLWFVTQKMYFAD